MYVCVSSPIWIQCLPRSLGPLSPRVRRSGLRTVMFYPTPHPHTHTHTHTEREREREREVVRTVIVSLFSADNEPIPVRFPYLVVCVGIVTVNEL